MEKSSIIRRVLVLAGIGIVIGLSVGSYLYFMPHRNVAETPVFATLTAKQLTDAYQLDPKVANDRYLAQDGNSKVLVITGAIAKISENQSGETVVLIKDGEQKVGVQATLIKSSDSRIAALRSGDLVAVKGAFTAGSSYDADLDLYDHAVLTQATLISVQHLH